MICDIEFGHVMAALEHSSICNHVCACTSGVKQSSLSVCCLQSVW